LTSIGSRLKSLEVDVEEVDARGVGVAAGAVVNGGEEDAVVVGTAGDVVSGTKGESGKASGSEACAFWVASRRDLEINSPRGFGGSLAGSGSLWGAVGSDSSFDSAAPFLELLRERADLCIDRVLFTDWPLDIEEAWKPSWAGSRCPSSCSCAAASARSCWVKRSDSRHFSSPQ